MNNTLITVGYRDRPTELYGLLNSLRIQTIKDWDLLIIDDASTTPIQNYYFIQQMLAKLQNEGHKIIYIKNNASGGVSAMRQQCVEFGLQGTWKYQLRIDDDSIAEPDYIEQLFKVINAGYDIASGVVPIFGAPETKRDIEFVKPIIGECELDSEGNLVLNLDDCGQLYNVQAILPSHHFRSCALVKREVFEAGVNYKSRLSKNGFREEQIFSFKALIAGFKIGVNTGAICWHLNCPSGGERDTMNLGRLNQETLDYTTKRMFEDNGDFIRKFNVSNGLQTKIKTKLDYISPNNLVTKKPNITINDMMELKNED